MADDDCDTHRWLKNELGEPALSEPADVVAFYRTPAERRLARRANIHDWVLITFTTVMVVCGLVVVIGWRHADRRADQVNARANTSTGAVVQALLSGRAASDAIATLANDFVDLEAAKSNAERQAALDRLQADRLKAQIERDKANQALARLEQTQVTGNHRAAATTTTARASPGATTTTTSQPPPASTTTTTSTVPPVVPCPTVPRVTIPRCG